MGRKKNVAKMWIWPGVAAQSPSPCRSLFISATFDNTKCHQKHTERALNMNLILYGLSFVVIAAAVFFFSLFRRCWNFRRILYIPCSPFFPFYIHQYPESVQIFVVVAFFFHKWFPYVCSIHSSVVICNGMLLNICCMFWYFIFLFLFCFQLKN